MVADEVGLIEVAGIEGGAGPGGVWIDCLEMEGAAEAENASQMLGAEAGEAEREAAEVADGEIRLIGEPIEICVAMVLPQVSDCALNWGEWRRADLVD